MRDLVIRIFIGVLLCVLTPVFAVNWIIHNLEISWWNIFMVGGLESLWVYLCWDISKWIRQAWENYKDRPS